jgi:hypothetical protein
VIRLRIARSSSADLRAAAHDVGFFYVTGHGVPRAITDGIAALARRFFALPLPQRLEIENVHSPQFRGYTRVGAEQTAGGPLASEEATAGRCGERGGHLRPPGRGGPRGGGDDGGERRDLPRRAPPQATGHPARQPDRSGRMVAAEGECGRWARAVRVVAVDKFGQHGVEGATSAAQVTI